MQKFGLYSVKDNLTGFSAPTHDLNDATAVRNFGYAMQNIPQYAHKPSDYDLYKVGEFDPDTGAITSTIPKIIIHGTDFFHNKENEENVFVIPSAEKFLEKGE